jgi:hypothetical protein
MPYADQHSEAAKASQKRRSKKYYDANRDTICEVSRNWRKGNKALVKEQKHRHTMKHKDRSLTKIIAWKEADQNRVRASGRAYIRRIKEQFISAYGGACQCCGETTYEFLSLDHIGGGGRAGCGGVKSYLKARREGWPKDKYRLLCMNCNFSYGRYGMCPHKSLREQINEEVA